MKWVIVGYSEYSKSKIYLTKHSDVRGEAFWSQDRGNAKRFKDPREARRIAKYWMSRVVRLVPKRSTLPIGTETK